MQTLVIDSFAGREHEKFVFRRQAARGSDSPTEMELEMIEVTSCGPRLEATSGGPGSPMRQPFSLLFKGPPGPPLDACMHEMVHPDMEPCALFISPVQLSPWQRRADEPCTYYEVIFA